MTEQPQDPPADPEAGRIESLDQRFGQIEAKQAEHDGKLDQILAKLGGAAAGEGKTHAAQAHTEQRLDAGSTIADQVRRAVEAVGAEKAEKDKADAHERDRQALKEMREHPPREPQGGWRGKLQKAMYGGDPK